MRRIKQSRKKVGFLAFFQGRSRFASALYLVFSLLCGLYSGPIYAMCLGVGCSCSVATSAVSFGNYNPIAATATTTTGNVAVTCSAIIAGLISYVISLNAGNSGSFVTRYMNLPGNHLNYNLYTSAAYTSVWGNGTGGTSTVSDSYFLLGGPNLKNYSVYGQIPAVQTVPAGMYTDTITVSVVY